MIKIYTLVLLIILTASCKEEKSRNSTAPVTEMQQKTEISRDSLNKFLRVGNPMPGQLITSPLKITGEARGYWFFEANAPVELLNGNLQTISETYITALGEWMTTDWVPFTGTMAFEKPETERGFFVLHKANASGLKEHNISDTIPVKFQMQN
ncbi:MAG: Gmad2 immunoglobulin-like domain-containing protein [Gillisia sp.]